MRTATTKFGIRTVAASDPTWFAGQTERTWQAVGNTLSDVDPCPAGNCVYSEISKQEGVVNAWVGAAASPSSLIIAAQGGHTAYGGNEVYEFEFLSETPQWFRRVDPAPYGGAGSASNGQYPDGTPVTRHGYGHDVFLPASVTNGNRWVALFGYASQWESVGTDRAASWQRGAASWDTVGSIFPDWPGNIDYQALAVFNPGDSLVWIKEANAAVAGGVYTFNPATNSYTAEGGSWAIGQSNTSGAIDPIRRIFLFWDGSGSLYGIDLDAPSASPVTISTTGSGPSGATGPGLVFDPISNKFIAWTGGATVYTLTPAASWKTGSWVWAAVPNNGGSATPSSPQPNGTFGRFNYIEALNALCVVNTTADQMYVYKLPSGGV